jgi:hypothetical protein
MDEVFTLEQIARELTALAANVRAARNDVRALAPGIAAMPTGAEFEAMLDAAFVPLRAAIVATDEKIAGTIATLACLQVEYRRQVDQIGRYIAHADKAG